MQILHGGHSDSAFEQAGRPPANMNRAFYGEIVIRQLGIPSHLKIYRSSENQNYFWIAVPHADGLGTHYPLLALGSEFANLVQSTSVSK